jgi:hypothetical protein
MSSQSSISSYISNATFNTSRGISAFLDIDRIKGNPLYKCIVTGGRTNKINVLSKITGIYNPDAPFSVSVGSEYVDSFELPFDTSKLNAVANFAANMSGKTQFILKSLRMTEQRWNGSTSPEFNVKLDIPIIRASDASWSVLKYALQATTGTLNDYSSNGQTQTVDGSLQIFAPNGYRINYSKDANKQDTPSGTYTVQLGEGRTCWFRMSDAVITNSDVSISGKKYYDGNPTSISVSISFKYWRQPLFEDIVQWFPLANRISI